MKKLALGIMMVLGMGVGLNQVNAQNISAGVKVDANMSNFLLNDMGNASSKMKFGASIGGFVKFDIVENFAIQPELLFNYQSSEMKVAGVKRDYEYWGMEIPVYAMGQWKVGSNDRFYAGVGPYVGIGFSAKYKSPEQKLYKDDVLQPWDFGFGAQLGYEFSNRIQINASYKIGIVDALDKGKDDATMLPQKVSLGVAYRF